MSPIIKKDDIWKIALYLRLSREDGKDESRSIENQKKILMEYIQNAIKEPYEIQGIYIDDGITGTDTNRPGFMAMEKEMLRGSINCIIVKSLARAFRNLSDQQKYLEEIFPLHNIRFITLGTPFIDTYSNSEIYSSLEIPIYGMFNEQFAAATSEEVRKTFNTKRKKGEFIGAFAPYGYKKDPNNKNKLLIDEDVSFVVKSIFQWFIYGTETFEKLTVKGIAEKLNEMGIPCPSRYKHEKGFNYCNPYTKYKDCQWTGTTISHILKNLVYTGCMVQGRHRIINYKVHKQVNVPENQWFVCENTHEAIISKEIYNTAQNLIGRNTRAVSGKKIRCPYSGLIICGYCQKPFHRKSSGKNIYYHCRNTNINKKCLNTKSIRLDLLDKTLFHVINSQFLLTELKHILVPIPKDTNSLPLQSVRDSLDKEIKSYGKLTANLYKDWKSGYITKEEFLQIKKNFSEKENSLRNILENTTTDVSASAAKEKLFQYYINYCPDKNPALKHVDSIIITKNNTLTFNLNYKDIYFRCVSE